MPILTAYSEHVLFHPIQSLCSKKTKTKYSISLPNRASLAGITALPTDPTLLLSLGPLANSLAAQLPTSSVLSVLVTAAPSGFVSSIVNDPSYANSFESAFAAGNSPSWFNALPTDVKSYLHTYTGFGAVAGAAGALNSAAGSEILATETQMQTGSETGTAMMTGSAASEASGTAASGARGSEATSGESRASEPLATMTGSAAGSAATSGAEVASSGASSVGSEVSSEATAAKSNAASGASAVSSNAAPTGGAFGLVAQPTGILAAGAAAVALGLLGMAF